LEAVLVETRVRELLQVAEVCVNARKHVHLDKPAGQSLSQFGRLLKAAERQRLLVQLGYMHRYNPAVVLLRKFVRSGWLGDVFEVHSVMSKAVDEKIRAELGQYQGGMLFELGCHLIDLVMSLLGEPKQVASYNQHVSRVNDTLIDSTLAVLVYPAATATVRSTALEVEGFARRHVTVCGTEGTFHLQPLDNPSVRLALSKSRDEYKAGYQDVKLPHFSPYVEDAAEMARVIRGEKTPTLLMPTTWAFRRPC
jgi:predicted dehydrogenase